MVEIDYVSTEKRRSYDKFFFFSSRRRHTRSFHVTGVQTCALPIAKGVSFPLEKLLADPERAGRFVGGGYATLYLAPRDYHRIHAPLAGRITGYSYIPGELWPVNRASVRLQEKLFCLNERLTTYLETRAGELAVVKVGATCVARIRAAYDDLVTHTGGRATVHRYERPIPVAKGAELGVFEMGSTVI